jgi:hypothetical protein
MVDFIMITKRNKKSEDLVIIFAREFRSLDSIPANIIADQDSK